MANLSVDFSGDLEKQLTALAQTDEIAQDILEAASEPLVESLKQQCNKHRRTGKMADSIKAGKVKKFKDGGYYITVAPTGKSTQYKGDNGKVYKRDKAVTNYELLMHIELGTKKQPKQPLIANACRDASNRCTDILQQKYAEYASKKGGSA